MAAMVYFLCTSIIGGTAAMFSSKALEGYPSGFLADCPGSNKPAIITPKSLKHLTLSVMGSSNILSRKNKYTYYEMKLLAKDPGLDFRRKTMLYVGGYMDSTNFPIALSLGKHYRDLGYNVLLLDTNRFTTTHYPIASRFIRAVGRNSAEMLANLTSLGLDPKKLELVGLSLGGQTMSFLAKNYRLLTGRNISRLTGLDPSGPCFRNMGPEERLDKSDADFVDVIATNIDGYGMAAPMGHVNFYVNGGEYQPGDVFWMLCNIVCSHIRVFTLWLAALENPNTFIAMQCDSVQQARDRDCYDRKPRVTNVVGLNTDRTKQGIFYLATRNNFPYFMGVKGLRKDNEFFKSTLSEMNADDLIKI